MIYISEYFVVQYILLKFGCVNKITFKIIENIYIYWNILLFNWIFETLEYWLFPMFFASACNDFKTR